MTLAIAEYERLSRRGRVCRPPLVEAVDRHEAAPLLMDAAADGLHARVDLQRPPLARDPPREELEPPRSAHDRDRLAGSDVEARRQIVRNLDVEPLRDGRRVLEGRLARTLPASVERDGVRGDSTRMVVGRQRGDALERVFEPRVVGDRVLGHVVARQRCLRDRARPGVGRRSPEVAQRIGEERPEVGGLPRLVAPVGGRRLRERLRARRAMAEGRRIGGGRLAFLGEVVHPRGLAGTCTRVKGASGQAIPRAEAFLGALPVAQGPARAPSRGGGHAAMTRLRCGRGDTLPPCVSMPLRDFYKLIAQNAIVRELHTRIDAIVRTPQRRSPPAFAHFARHPTVPTDLSLLACGAPPNPPTTDFDRMFHHISTSIDFVLRELAWLGTQDIQRVSMLGPFLGRSLLELSATAIIGRLDPLRLLFVAEIQGQAAYDPSEVWKGSLQWTGDVLAREKPPANLWHADLSYDKLTKALLGDYYDHLLWRPAVDAMLASAPGGGAWLAQLAGISSDAFVARKRQEVRSLYSSLSKGIHHEFVLPPGALYDRATVVDLVQRGVHVAADIALASHFIPHVPFALPALQAFEVFGRIENLEALR